MKAYLTKKHFNEIEKGDCILVTNYHKNGKDGYLGGAVLGIGVGIGIYKLLKYAESRLSPVNLFARNPMKNREASLIIITGLFIMIMCIGVIALLLQNKIITG
jgi:hypothetical protein